MAAITTVIFDLDGTLVDSNPGIAQAFGKALQQRLPGSAMPEFTRFIGPPVREVFRKALGCTDEILLNDLNLSFRRFYDEEDWKASYPYSGTVELLEYLKGHGVTCNVLTNKPSFATRKILQHTRMDLFFSEVISPDSATPPFQTKSDAACYLLLRGGGLDPSTTWLVGDSEDDAAAAAALGCCFAAAAYGYGEGAHQKQFPVHAILKELPDFRSIFSTLHNSADFPTS